jgi:hypothetical protein
LREERRKNILFPLPCVQLYTPFRRRFPHCLEVGRTATEECPIVVTVVERGFDEVGREVVGKGDELFGAEEKGETEFNEGGREDVDERSEVVYEDVAGAMEGLGGREGEGGQGLKRADRLSEVDDGVLVDKGEGEAAKLEVRGEVSREVGIEVCGEGFNRGGVDGEGGEEGSGNMAAAMFDLECVEVQIREWAQSSNGRCVGVPERTSQDDLRNRRGELFEDLEDPGSYPTAS